MKPGTDERDAERAVRDAIERVETEPQKTAVEIEEVCVPLTVVEKGDSTGESAMKAQTPDGQPAGMRGRVLTAVSAMEVYHRKMQALKPCVSCQHMFFPARDTREWADRAAHVAFAHRIGSIERDATELEFGGCTVKKMWVQVNYTCPLHRFRRGWWSRVKEWFLRRGRERHGDPS